MADKQDQTNSEPIQPPKRKSRALRWGIVIFILLIVFAALSNLCADGRYLTKLKMTKVASALDLVEHALITTYHAKGKVPVINTVITQSNQGKPATPDWASLGYINLPSLPPEISRLSINADGEIVVTLTNIDEAIDNSELRAIAVLEPMKSKPDFRWEYECTSVSNMFRKFFRCR
jgi:hypothetical protein